MDQEKAIAFKKFRWCAIGEYILEAPSGKTPDILEEDVWDSDLLIASAFDSGAADCIIEAHNANLDEIAVKAEQKGD